MKKTPNIKMNQPVSILIRTHNRPELLEQAINSVLKQTYKELEIVIVDNSEKENLSNIHKIFEHSQIKWQYKYLSNNNSRGVAANQAMEMASGNLFLFLDDDDLLLENHLKTLTKALNESDKKYIGAYSGIQCFDDQSAPENNPRLKVFNSPFSRTRLASENYLPIHAVLFKKAAYTAGCRFNETLETYEDWHFWLQVIAHGDLLHVNEISALYRLNISGVGSPVQGQDFSSDFDKFLSLASNLWDNQQKLHLIHAGKTLTTCQEKLTDRNLEFDHLNISYEFNKKIIGDLENVLESRDKEVKSLVESHDKEIKSLVESHDKEIRSLVKSHDKEINYFVNEINSLISSHDKEIETKSGEIKRLYEKNLQLTAKSNELEALLQPLPSIKRLLSHLLHYIPEKTSPYFSIYRKKGSKAAELIYNRDFGTFFQKIKNQFRHSPINKSSENPEISILATKHTLYVAYLLKETLVFFGFNNIHIINPEKALNFQDHLHFVVCPQMFKKLPNVYISFQMEQSVSSRWFTDKYYSTLENSFAILDYSQKNIAYILKNSGLCFQQLFWAPISNIKNYRSKYFPGTTRPDKTYDAVFYGDANCPRRKKILHEVSKKFNVLLISEVYGEELYAELLKAQVVINIHYYEGALLETTRIFECLSLGLPVVSEEAADEHPYLSDYVKFVPVDDIEALCEAIEKEINSPRPGHKKELPDDLTNFRFYLGRMLVSYGLMPADKLLTNQPAMVKSNLTKRIALSLPETVDRHSYIKKLLPQAEIFPGIRSQKSWVGAALSYKALSIQALEQNKSHIEICEDDVEIYNDFEDRYEIIKDFLFNQLSTGQWDIFCGFIADLHPETVIKNVFNYRNTTFIEINKMTSMVFNIYNEKAIHALSKWDEKNNDVNSNTIDRYLEHLDLSIITTAPFLVGHLSSHESTLWNTNNTTYDSLIDKSQKRLTKKLEEYLLTHTIINLDSRTKSL